MTKVKKDKLYALSEEFKMQFIKTDGIILQCTVCDVNISIGEKHRRNKINQHIQYTKYVKNVELRKSKSKQTTLIHAFASESKKQRSLSEFRANLTMALIQSRIPIHKVNNPAFKSFLVKCMQKSILDETTLRKNYIQSIYEYFFQKIKEAVGKHNVGFILDENTELVEDMEKEEQWKKLMSVRDNLDGFAKVKFELNLKNNPDVETFATLTELPLRVLRRYVPLVSVAIERQRLTVENIETLRVIQYNKLIKTQ
ncbi:hypothetical protein ANN_09659 [Periplaneta americana]|uniref:Uncharacterized protein n=1 Tax=Periplaneta americana TaxID=6978 RepID=A0ABQ8TNM9_PERAM|nr:hypothetical protein ANN_09659 [Periplaneta americana]